MIDDIDRRMADLVLKGFDRDGIATMSRADAESYLSMACQAAYQLLRNVAGDEWVRDWLEAALADLANPAPIQFRKPS